MTDEELIARLRKADEYEPLGHDGWEAADRIEALVKARREDALELLAAHGQAQDAYEAQLKAEAQNAALTARVEGLTGALERVDQWADAYPLDVFPEPDFAKADEVLKGAGLSLGAISASNMRHVIEGVKSITSATLSATTEEGHE